MSPTKESPVERSWSWVRRRVEPIGLDLGTRFVRMLQLSRNRGQMTVVACAERALPPGAHSPADYERLRAEAVADMLAKNSFVGRLVVTSLAADDLQIRNLRVPNMPEEEIGEVVRYEAADRLGLETASAELRYMLAGDVRQGADVRQEVIVFGATQTAVKSHVDMLVRMGLQPAAVDASPCAIFRGFERFLRRNEDRQLVNAFLDLGYSGSRIVISRGPDIIFYKAIPIGGGRFDELVATQLDLSLPEAAELRIRVLRQHIATITGQQMPTGEEAVGESTRRAMLDAMRPALEQLSKEIALCLRYCSVTFRGMKCDEVTVIGGEACNQDLLQMLSDQANVPFRVGKALRNVGSEPDFGGADRRTGQPEWAVPLGLALKPVSWAEAAA
jgi:type IV pilus assembly protein PilM